MHCNMSTKMIAAGAVGMVVVFLVVQTQNNAQREAIAMLQSRADAVELAVNIRGAKPLQTDFFFG